MFLGPFKELRAMLDREFGKRFYTDDNEVVDPRRKQATVATLWVIKPNRVRIKFIDRRKKSRLVTVMGAMP
jgi:hypothetical protein